MPDHPRVGFVEPGGAPGRGGPVDVVVIAGEAARFAAADLGLRTGGRGPCSGRRWLAVASRSGVVLGAALALDGPAAQPWTVSVACSEHAGRDLVTERLLTALGPLARGRGFRLASENDCVLGLPARLN